MSACHCPDCTTERTARDQRAGIPSWSPAAQLRLIAANIDAVTAGDEEARMCRAIADSMVPRPEDDELLSEAADVLDAFADNISRPMVMAVALRGMARR